MDCSENRLLTSRRNVLLGGASFAAWAYLPNSPVPPVGVSPG